MEIVKYPNDILRTKCTKITKNDKDVIALLGKMRQWVANDENKAIGLALPQVGIAKQGFVFLNQSTQKIEIAINPIIKKKASFVPSYEGCLSIPGQHTYVSRAKEIHVLFFNEQMKAVQKVLHNKRTAATFQHEFDHLHGILYIDLPQLHPLAEEDDD